MAMALFAGLTRAAESEIFSLYGEYLRDTSPNKISLILGVYKTEEGTSWPLPSVELAENQLKAETNPGRHDYLDIGGDPEFLRLARDLAFSFDMQATRHDTEIDRVKSRIVSIQTVSGSGANHIGAEFLSRTLPPFKVWLPNPTWPNHRAIWLRAGVQVAEYPYYSERNQSFDFDYCLLVLENSAKRGDVILLHACAHNPTGADPTREQWIAIAEFCNRRGLIPFFDMAYQGFASGDAASDAWVIQHFLQVQGGKEFLVAQSFAKNFGLYGQRVGALHVVMSVSAGQKQNAALIKSNLCQLSLDEFSSCPRAGSDIVRTILEDETLRAVWEQDLIVMSERIKTMRRVLYDELTRLKTPGCWDHILTQIGLFTYTGLTHEQVSHIRSKHHIYILHSGRISLSGLCGKNVFYVAQAINDAVRTSIDGQS